MEADKKRDEKKRSDKNKAVAHMVQDVVAHFVAEHEKGFRGCRIFDRRVPHDDPFRCAKPGDIGVDLIGLHAGLHQEHALARNRHTRAVHDAFDGRHQIGMRFVERLELIEERINDHGSDKEDEQQDRQRGNPEVKPPAARAAANHAIENPRQQSGDDQKYHLDLGPIPEPRAPVLDGLLVFQGKRMSVDARGQLQDRGGKHQQRDKNHHLNKSHTRSAFRPVAVFRGNAEAQDDPENQ